METERRHDTFGGPLQSLADSCCHHFGLKPIPIYCCKINPKYAGLYSGNKIEIQIPAYDAKKTLLHELAHHLRAHRAAVLHLKGYCKTEFWPKMMPSAQHPGWYEPSGPLEPVYLITGPTHGKAFWKCYDDIVSWDSDHKPRGASPGRSRGDKKHERKGNTRSGRVSPDKHGSK